MGKNDSNDTLAAMAKQIREMQAEKEAMLLELAKAKKASTGKLSLKVSEKGALSVYGMGRFPVTLYSGQWEKLLADSTVASIKQFIVEHAKELATKDAPVVASPVTGGTATAPAPAGKAF